MQRIEKSIRDVLMVVERLNFIFGNAEVDNFD